MSINTNADRRASVCLREEDDAPVLSPPRRHRPDGMPVQLCGLCPVEDLDYATRRAASPGITRKQFNGHGDPGTQVRGFIDHANGFGPELVLESASHELGPRQLGVLVQELRRTPPLQLKEASGRPAGQVKFSLSRDQTSELRERMEAAGVPGRTIRELLGRQVVEKPNCHAKGFESPLIEQDLDRKVGGPVVYPSSAETGAVSVTLSDGLKRANCPCGRQCIAQRKSARYCSDACRKKASRERTAVST